MASSGRTQGADLRGILPLKSLFLTVGSQTPFDRLVTAVNQWARQQNQWAVQAQIGQTQLAQAERDALHCLGTLSSHEYEQHCRCADLIVAHAGMGTVLTALQMGKPLVVLPRRAAFRETRNDHQLGTLRWLADRPGIWCALDETELPHTLDRACASIMNGEFSEPVIAASCQGPLVSFLKQRLQAHLHP
mgnify:CR=1 FL=1